MSLLAAFVLGMQSRSIAQFHFSGEGAIGAVQSNSGLSQTVFNNGHGTFLWSSDLFADAVISDNILFFSTVNLEQNGSPEIERFDLRFTDLASSGIDLDIGQIDLPFGNLNERRFPSKNPFFRLPLMHEYQTTLNTTDYKLRILYPPGIMNSNGVPLLNGDLYDLGMKISGEFGMFDYSFALVNGMLSSSADYSSNGLNPKDGFGEIMRIGFTPCPELNAGFSYGYGPFMADQSNDSASAIFSDNPTEYPQRTYGGDFTFAMNHVTLYGEAIYNIWYFEDIPNLEAFGYSIEGRWAVTPRFFAAARAGGVRFNEISGDIPAFPSGETSYSGRWDHNAIRLEGSIGLRVSRETLLKAIYEHDNTGDFAGEPNVDVFALQTVFSF